MSKQLKPVPKFANEAEEQVFWEKHDSTDYLDWTKAQRVALPNLKPTTKTISLRLPQHLLDSNESPRSKLRGINPQSKSCCPADSFRCKQRGIEPKEIKAAANSRDVSYQSLIKLWLQEKLHSH